MKHNTTGDEIESSSHGLWGTVNMRAAALLRGGTVAAGAGAAAMPNFLSVPSLRRSPSALKVDENGGIIEQSPSNYYEMEGAHGESELPQSIELSRSGSLTPYMV